MTVGRAGAPAGAEGPRSALVTGVTGGTGAAALCGGGGQGDALIIRVPGT